jgi:hypothetical protein
MATGNLSNNSNFEKIRAKKRIEEATTTYGQEEVSRITSLPGGPAVGASAPAGPDL